MKNARFEIVGMLGGDVMTQDLCADFSNPQAAALHMSRGLRSGLARSDREWALAEPLKASTSQVELDALAHYLTDPSIAQRNKIQQAFGPSLGQDAPSPESPRISAPSLATWPRLPS